MGIYPVILCAIPAWQGVSRFSLAVDDASCAMMYAHTDFCRETMADHACRKRKILSEIDENKQVCAPKTPKRSPYGSGKKSRTKQLASARRERENKRNKDENSNNNNNSVDTMDVPRGLPTQPATPGPLSATSSSNGSVPTPSNGSVPTPSSNGSVSTPSSADCSLVKGASESTSGYKIRAMKLATGDVKTTKGKSISSAILK